MVTPQSQAKLALLRDGRVLVAGLQCCPERADSVTPLATAKLFDPENRAMLPL